jgi:hypothetical protein
VIAGIGLIITVMVNPDGIAGRTAEQFERLMARFGPKPKKSEPPARPPAATEATDVPGPQAVGRGA